MGTGTGWGRYLCVLHKRFQTYTILFMMSHNFPQISCYPCLASDFFGSKEATATLTIVLNPLCCVR